MKINNIFKHLSAQSARDGAATTMRKRVLLVCCAAILLSAALVTAALLIKVTPSVNNNFKLPQIKNEIVEEFDEEKTEKKSVKIKNIGDSNEYVRVAIVVNWADEEGSVYAVSPVAGTDYQISFNSTDWKKHEDGYFYYKSLLKPEETTTNILGSSVVALKDAPNGYHLSVEIVEEAIQAEPVNAVKEAWGLTAKDGKLLFD